MVSDDDNFIFDVTGNDAHGIPDRHDLVVHYHFRSGKQRLRQEFMTDRVRTMIDQLNGAIRTALLDLFEENLRISPRDRQARDLGDIFALGASDILISRIARRCRIPRVKRQELDRATLN